MVATILLAGGLLLVGLLIMTYVLVQRRLRTLDEDAFADWFSRAFFGMSRGVNASASRPKSARKKRQGLKAQQTSPVLNADGRDRVGVDSTHSP